MENVSHEKLRDIIESFNDWIWCDCRDCRTDSHSHAVDTEASKTKIADYIIKELKNGGN